MSIETINPATGALIQCYEKMPTPAIHALISQSHEAYLAWRSIKIEKRATFMAHLAAMLLENSQEYAALITREMGKPIAAAITEIEKCAKVCRYYADHTDAFLQPKIVETDMEKSYVSFQPLGPIFGIMPWNFPFWQVFRFAAPTIMAGNTVLLKHAPITTEIGLTIERLFRFAGFPDNIFKALVMDEAQAEDVISHPQVLGVTLTGSERAGKAVASLAGQHLKKTVLELGGSDPYIILLDADLEYAAETCVVSRLNNSGQTCIAAKRLIVIGEIKNQFQRLVLDKLKRYKMGDPMDETVDLGPLARSDLRDKVHAQVQESIKQGATLLLGGYMPEGEGFYYPITVLDNVTSGMPAYDDEIFGPVFSLISARSEDDAVHIANDTRFGLGAAVFTKDVCRGEEMAVQRIRAGNCAVNRPVASDTRLPFGGIKASGFGRELSHYGLYEFMNIKAVCVD